MSLHAIKEAIKELKPISFKYNKPGKVSGYRTGNPHAVWVMRKKDGVESTKIHIVQTGGVSDSGETLPSFRMFDMDKISDVKIIHDAVPFEVSDEYKPEWEGYTFVIVKI